MRHLTVAALAVTSLGLIGLVLLLTLKSSKRSVVQSRSNASMKSSGTLQKQIESPGSVSGSTDGFAGTPVENAEGADTVRASLVTPHTDGVDDCVDVDGMSEEAMEEQRRLYALFGSPAEPSVPVHHHTQNGDDTVDGGENGVTVAEPLSAIVKSPCKSRLLNIPVLPVECTEDGYLRMLLRIGRARRSYPRAVRRRCLITDSFYMLRDHVRIVNDGSVLRGVDFVDDLDKLEVAQGSGIFRDWLTTLWRRILETNVFEEKPTGISGGRELQLSVELPFQDKAVQEQLKRITHVAALTLLMHYRRNMSIGIPVSYAVFLELCGERFSTENLKLYDIHRFNAFKDEGTLLYRADWDVPETFQYDVDVPTCPDQTSSDPVPQSRLFVFRQDNGNAKTVTDSSSTREYLKDQYAFDTFRVKNSDAPATDYWLSIHHTHPGVSRLVNDEDTLNRVRDVLGKQSTVGEVISALDVFGHRGLEEEHIRNFITDFASRNPHNLNNLLRVWTGESTIPEGERVKISIEDTPLSQIFRGKDFGEHSFPAEYKVHTCSRKIDLSRPNIVQVRSTDKFSVRKAGYGGNSSPRRKFSLL